MFVADSYRFLICFGNAYNYYHIFIPTNINHQPEVLKVKRHVASTNVTNRKPANEASMSLYPTQLFCCDYRGEFRNVMALFIVYLGRYLVLFNLLVFDTVDFIGLQCITETSICMVCACQHDQQGCKVGRLLSSNNIV